MSRIFLSKAHVTQVEEELVVEAVRSGWVAPLGPFVDRFEAEVAERVGVAGALALSSGTAALHLALLELGAKPGTVVVTSSMTFAATANAIAYTGATPVFVDSLAQDANLSPELLRQALTALRDEGTTVAAVVPVDLYGRACDYEAIGAICADHDVPLLEDAAEALGAGRGGRAAGSFGRAAALSFNGNKIMTTSGGGMLLGDDTELIERCRYLSTQARRPAPWYEHTEIGYNYRLSNVLAALGLGQLSRLDEMIARRREIRQRYVDAFAQVEGVRFLGRDGEPGDEGDNCWLTSMVLDPAHLDVDVDDVVAQMDARDIEVRHLWKPMHAQPVFAGARSFLDGTADSLFAHGLNLPSGSILTDEEVERVVGALGEVLRVSVR